MSLKTSLTEHELLVRDADRLTELVPILRQLEARLSEIGLKVEYEFPSEEITQILCDVIMPSGHRADVIKFHYQERMVKDPGTGSKQKTIILICEVSAIGTRTRRYERSSVVGLFNWPLICEAVHEAALADEKWHREMETSKANEKLANRLKRQVSESGLSRIISIYSAKSRENAVQFRIEFRNDVDADQAEKLIFRLAPLLSGFREEENED